MRSFVLGAAALIVCAAAAQAHVTVSPTDSVPGDTQLYTVRVPTEGSSPTVSLEMTVPANVSIEPTKSASYEIKQSDGHKVLAWKLNIAPGKFEELKFMAKNPDAAGNIVWAFSQGFADGSKTVWGEAAGGKQPAAVTKLAAEIHLAPSN